MWSKSFYRFCSNDRYSGYCYAFFFLVKKVPGSSNCSIQCVIRPGTERIEAAGGLHKFMNCKLPILTD